MTAPAGGLRPTGSSARQRRVAVLVPAQADGGRRFEQVRRFACCNRVELAQRSEVVEHPDRATLRAGDQVVAVHEQVADPGRRKIALQRLPMVAVVEGHEHAGIGAGVEQARALQVGAHDADEMVGRKFAYGERPGRARSRACGRSRAGNRPADDCRRRRRPCPRCVGDGSTVLTLAHGAMPFRRHVGPGLAAVAGQAHEAVVGADPDLVVVARRKPDAEDRRRSRRRARAPRLEIAVAVARRALRAERSGLIASQCAPWSERAEEPVRPSTAGTARAGTARSA